MSVGLEGPAPYYSPPPEDAEPMTLGEYLRGALALIAQDQIVGEDEKREIALFMAGLQMIGQANMAAQGAQVQPGDGLFQPGEEEPFGAGGEGTEAVDPTMEGEEPF